MPVVIALVVLLGSAALVGLTRPEVGPLAVYDPGPWARWGLPIARLSANVSSVLVVGLFLVAAFVESLPGLRTTTGGLRVNAAGLALMAAVTRSAEVFFASCDIAGTPPQEMSWHEVWLCMKLEVNIYRLSGAAAMALVSVLVATRRNSRMVLLGALAATALPFLGGHASSAANHELAVALVVAHVLTASLWVGGLGGLLLLSFVPPLRVVIPRLVPRFSQLAFVCAAATAATGIGNLVARWPDQGFGATYLVLVASKSVAFAVLCGFGWQHRLRLQRRPAATDPGFLRRSYLELGVMALTMALATVLASSAPT